jgi:hypothetical protein
VIWLLLAMAVVGFLLLGWAIIAGERIERQVDREFEADRLQRKASIEQSVREYWASRLRHGSSTPTPAIADAWSAKWPFHRAPPTPRR